MAFAKKTTIALILVTVSLFIILYLRQLNVIWFDALLMIFVIFAVFELDSAFRKNGYKTIRAVLIVALLFIHPMFIYFGLKGAVLVTILSFMIGASIITFNHNYSYKDLTATSFILIYPMLMLFIFGEINHTTGGLFGIMMVLMVTVLSDTFAQWTGMAIGGKKLCPTISPNKTVAGACGSYLGGLIGAAAMFLIFEYFLLFKNVPNVYFVGLTSSPWKSLPLYIVLAILGTTSTQIGDLFASWMKRQFGLKDFGTILPGHGGVMDRADSMIFTASLMYLIFLFIPALEQ